MPERNKSRRTFTVNMPPTWYLQKHILLEIGYSRYNITIQSVG
jgi:hypothetical protein